MGKECSPAQEWPGLQAEAGIGDNLYNNQEGRVPIKAISLLD
jgi:hypothetical protein